MGFKVIIVGGSVSGLSLANMLERLDVDYTLLEAYPNIAPQVGASIGLLPNGFRILDQLDCFEPILEMVGEYHLKNSLCGPDGKPLGPPSMANIQHLEARLGYPSIFIDRQMLLQVLFDNLKNKDKVIPEKRVEKVELLKEGVRVHTKDGSVFEGDIVVGADGIHSTVREEMWRIGHEERPGYFPLDEHSRVPVATKCIFGISKRPSNLPIHNQQMVLNEGRSYLIISAPGNRTYWFLFSGVGDTKYGKDIPKYSKEDTEKLALEHWEDLVFENVTFGDVYKNKIMATLVPLEEYVFEKWHYQRIVCIGDASHKIDPISGQGGNGALEAAALLTNSLTDMLEKNPKSQPTEIVEAALAQVHINRHERAKTLVANAHTLQQVLTGRSPYSKIVTKYLVPLLGDEGFLGTAVPICKASHRVYRLPLPQRRRLVPFDDELPARPITTQAASRMALVLASGSFAALLYYSGGFTHFSELKKSVRLWMAGAWDLGLAQATSNLTKTSSLGSLIEQIQFKASLFSALVIWLAESHRFGNRLSVFLWPSISAAAFTAFGPKAVMPLLGLGIVTRGPNTLPGRHVPIKYAKAILPSAIVGYAIPTILASLPIQDTQIRQAVGFVVSAAPVFSAALLNGVASAIQKVKDRTSFSKATKDVKETDKDEFVEMYDKKDVVPLKMAYTFAAGACATVHIASAVYPILATTSFNNLAGGLNTSIGLFGLASAALSLYSAWNLRSEGFVTTQQALLGSLGSIASGFAVGPGAALAGFYYWLIGIRESRFKLDDVERCRQ
ncbi:FAD binding domain-containing protein [Colletotrichum lupini]|uniref:FAD binding domain-containing protein n=1 Tax=Colletotrichum lupini TaxID=145971 RepID=A0A9Q8SR21_9PEZI|nr:FAD binding domain-containing protein [Colletotrichum lupini]UQC81979.1 FAD binding domain-containing protein [Colletotrichum lupini]